MPCKKTAERTVRRSTLVAVAFILVLALVLPWGCLAAQAQTVTPFTKADTFSIPQGTTVNTISFNVSGTYEHAALENGAWTFEGLTFTNLTQQGKLGLTVSAQNSNVTITSYRVTNATENGMGSVRINYLVVGDGTQTFNLGVSPNSGYWSVTIQRIYLSQYDGWDISPDGTVTVTGAKSGAVVTIMCYTYPTSFVDELNGSVYAQHSVLLATGAGVFVVLAVCLVIWRTNLQTSGQQKVPRRSRPLTIKHVDMEVTERE